MYNNISVGPINTAPPVPILCASTTWELVRYVKPLVVQGYTASYVQTQANETVVLVPIDVGVVPVTAGSDYDVIERSQNGIPSVTEGGYGHVEVGVSDLVGLGIQGGADSSGASSGGPYATIAGAQAQINAASASGVDVGLLYKPTQIEVGVNFQGSYYDDYYLIGTTQYINSVGGYESLGLQFAPGFQYDSVVIRTTNQFAITAWFANLGSPLPPYRYVP